MHVALSWSLRCPSDAEWSSDPSTFSTRAAGGASNPWTTQSDVQVDVSPVAQDFCPQPHQPCCVYLFPSLPTDALPSFHLISSVLIVICLFLKIPPTCYHHRLPLINRIVTQSWTSKCDCNFRWELSQPKNVENRIDHVLRWLVYLFWKGTNSLNFS